MIRCAWLLRRVRSRCAHWCGQGWALAQQGLALLLGLAALVMVAGLAVLAMTGKALLVLVGSAAALLVLAGLMVVDGVMEAVRR